MIAISWYILKVLIISGILCGYYYLVLKDKIFHRWNRFYLLITVTLSMLLPLVKINIFNFGADPGNIARALQTITLQDEIVIELGRKSAFSSNMLITYGYLLICLFLIATLISTLLKIRRIKNKYPLTKVNGVNFINTLEKGTPFSFFNSIFWNQSIDLHTTPGQQIFNHEVAHITEKHTYDKLFMNGVLLFFWINPFFWLIRKELNMIHEFIADKMALEDGDTNAFAEMILSSVFTRQQFSITNNFFYSPIKRRLMMLSKNKHSKVTYFTRLLALPLATLIFIGVSCKVKTESEMQKPDEQVEAGAPVGHERNLLTDSTPTMYVDNKKVIGLDVITPEGKPAMAKIFYEDGSNEILTFKEAEAKGIVIPPPSPPPPPPIATKYNGNSFKYDPTTISGGKVLLQYEDGTKETITREQAEKANLKIVDVKFTPPRIVKDIKSDESDISADDKVFTKVEQEASFPGGLEKWAQYITKVIAKDKDNFGEEDFGTCVVRFIVDKNGNVSEVKATTMQGTHLAKAAVSAIQNGPKWIPAMQNGLPVNAYRLQPITLSNPEK